MESEDLFDLGMLILATLAVIAVVLGARRKHSAFLGATVVPLLWFVYFYIAAFLDVQTITRHPLGTRLALGFLFIFLILDSFDNYIDLILARLSQFIKEHK